MINIESRKNPVDTLETNLLGTALRFFLGGFITFTIYHLCYELLPNLFPGDWSLGVFGYTVKNQAELPLAIIDVTIRDIVPICLVFGSLFLASIWITKRYKLTPLSQYSKKLVQLVDDMQKKGKTKIYRSYIMATPIANAFVFGIKRVSLVLTSGVDDLLEDSEVRSVIAHELGHVMNKDVGLMTWGEVYSKALTFFFPIIVTYEIIYSLWFKGPVWALLVRLIYVFVFVLLIPLMLFNSISRVREFLADARGSILTGCPDGLESALIAMEINNSKLRSRVSFPTHLLITRSHRVKHISRQKLFSVVSTHPLVKERLVALEKGKLLTDRMKFQVLK